MANDAHIHDFGYDEELAMQEFDLWQYECSLKQKKEHEEYLEELAKGDDYVWNIRQFS